MKTKFNFLVLFVLLGAMMLSACGAGGAAATEAPIMSNEFAFALEEPVAQDAGEADEGEVKENGFQVEVDEGNGEEEEEKDVKEEEGESGEDNRFAGEKKD